MVPGSALRPARPATPQDAALARCRVTSHGLSLRLEPSGGVSAALLHFPAGNAVFRRKLTVLRQVVLCSQSRRVAQIVVEAVGRANVLRASARHREVTPMTDKISQQPVPPLDPNGWAARDITSLATLLPSGSWPRRWLGGHDDRGARPWTWPTAWQLRGAGSSEVGRVQALANAR